MECGCCGGREAGGWISKIISKHFFEGGQGIGPEQTQPPQAAAGAAAAALWLRNSALCCHQKQNQKKEKETHQQIEKKE